MEKNKAVSGNSGSFLPLFLVVFLDMVGFGLIIPLLAPLMIDPASAVLPFATSHADRIFMLGLLLASFSIAQFFGGPILGALSDRFGRKPVLMLALSGTFAGYVLFAFGILMANLPLLFIGRFIGGFMGGSISVAFSSIADLSDSKQKAKNFGMIGMAFGLGFIIGPFLGVKLADDSLVSWFDYSTPFFAAALLTIINLLMVLWMFRETIVEKSHVKISLTTGFVNIAKAFSMPSLRTLFAIIFLLTFGFSFFTQFSQVFLIDRFNFTEPQIGDLFAFVGIWIAITQGLLTGMVAKKFSPAQVMKFAPIMLAASLFLLVFAFNVPALYAIIALVAISQGLVYPNYSALISDSAGRESQGEIFGINQSIQSLGLTLPPLISGVIAAADSTMPIVASAFFVFLAWIGFMAFYKPKAKEVFHEA